MKKTKENSKKTNFTKLTRSGISLIVLVITIIIILILAAAIIISLNNNNPVMEANKARYDSDVANMQAIFTNSVAKVMAHNRAVVSITPGQINSIIKGVSKTVGEVSYKVNNAMNEDYSDGIIVFGIGDNTDKKFFTGKELPIYSAGETKWYVDEEGNISLEVAGTKYGNGEKPPVSASTISKDASTYYGANVLNYTTKTETINNQVKWQIFYADTNNIYLISTDYVHYDLLPKKKIGTEEYKLNKYTNYKAYFTKITEAYNGSSDIVDTRLRVLNSSYYSLLNNKNSKSANMRVVAYMMDTDIWDTFNGEYSEYAIGGPTIEMFVKSYTQKYNVEYKAEAKSTKGYQISINGGTSWNTVNYIANKEDTLYVIRDTKKAGGMWLASPSDSGENNIIYVGYDRRIDNGPYNTGAPGFRPLVCLNSDVKLKEVEGGYKIIM